MKIFTLKRISETADGTYGVLIDEGGTPFCVSLERIWANNKPNESCIPVGEWLAKRHISTHFGETFEITGVPGRTDVLLHWGNFWQNSLGCILLGEKYDKIVNKLNGSIQNGIGESKEAFTEFMEKLKGEQEFRLVIVKA